MKRRLKLKWYIIFIVIAAVIAEYCFLGLIGGATYGHAWLTFGLVWIGCSAVYAMTALIEGLEKDHGKRIKKLFK